MQELIDGLERNSKVDYLLDTCFLFYSLEHGHTKKLLDFCGSHSVGMSSFNLSEVDHVHHRLKGTMNHHLRDFLKQKVVSCVPVGVVPGDRDGERKYVAEFDEKLLHIVPDASDAVLFVQALRVGANVLTRDKHHLFTAVAENYSEKYGIEVLNEIPKE